MPAIMALEGPPQRTSSNALRSFLRGAVRSSMGPRGRNVVSELGPVAGLGRERVAEAIRDRSIGLVMRGRGGAARLDGVTDTIKAHPWAIVAGLLFGAYALTKGWSPGMIWGEHHAAQTRERSLHGRKRRR